MNRSLVPLAVLIGFLTGSCKQNSASSVEPGPQPTQTVSASEIDAEVKALGQALKQELVAALGKGGAETAINVCRDRAPVLTATHSERTGWTIRRTALRVRNPDNAPDAWESRQLKLFQKRMAAGEDPSTLTSFETTGDQIRFARAIPTAAECLLCHGPAVDASTTATIAELYPHDEAIGFQIGDLRGIFSAKVPIP